MSKAKQPIRFRVATGEPEYVALLGEKLAELAIVRVPELVALKPPKGGPELPFDVVATSTTGVCFLVGVEAYSSFKLKIEPDAILALELEVGAKRLRSAHQSATPVVMFLFDADRGHGRFLRLDTLPEPPAGAKTAVLSFPVENTITGDSIRALAAELEKERAVPVAG